MESTHKQRPRLALHKGRLARPLTAAELLLFVAVGCTATSLTVCWPSLAANLFASARDGELGAPSARALRWLQVGLLTIGVVCGVVWWRLRRQPSWTTRLRLGHALALGLGVALGGTLAEVACRVGNRMQYGLWWRSPIPAQPPLIQVGPLRLLEPGCYSVPVRNDFTARVTRVPVYVNRFGLKGSEVTETKSTRWRILCVGGSTTYGWYLSNSQMYPAQLQRLLDQRYGLGQAEVLNAGVPAYTTQHVIQALQNRWFRLQPDTVLYYAGYNDVWHAFAEQHGSVPALETERPTDPASQSLDLGPPKTGPVRVSLATLALANPIANTLARWRSGFPVVDYSLSPNEAGRSRDALQPELIARYRRDLEELADLCESRGIKLALATFASSWNP
ncbi:MAG: hypothetical protein HY000_34025, partial [Planctomycetes bacterium]|nr:hypothetical protein [Planctomycetota bacterium]